MINIILSGCNGYMGRVVTSITAGDPAISIAAGIDIDDRKLADYPVFASPADLTGDSFDSDSAVIVDFSSPAALDGLLAYGISRNIPVILCATGYSPEQIAAVEKASRQIPVFRSGNMSLGINLLADLISRACSILGEEFDVEIVERHHRRKLDAPSGTALMLADAANAALPYDAEYIFERESRRKPREKREIGISAVRGGTIVGVHDVILAGQDEVIELRHTAASRDVFAVGAIRAAKFIVGKTPGMYKMSDIF